MAAVAKDAGLSALLAETSIANPASARVLEKNSFLSIGKRTDADDGEVLQWRKPLS